MQAENQEIKLSAVIEDFNIYPRHSVDSTHASQLIGAIDAGAILPPIVVEAETFRLVDGFHRVRCYRKTMDADAVIAAVVVKYDSAAELLAHAIELNAAHGKGLSSWDRLRCIELSKDKGLSYGDLARSLGTTEARLSKLETRRTARREDGSVVLLKRASLHLAGKVVTDGQAEAQRKLGGNQASFYFGQIIQLVESELLPKNNPELVGKARRTVDTLASWCAQFEIEEAVGE